MMRRPVPRRAGAPGFTLLELMIAVLIIGIIAAIAVPSYSRYVQRAHRGNAQAIMMETGQHLERFYSVTDTYAGVALLSAVSPKGSAGAGVRYNISYVAAPSAAGWTLQAVPANKQAGETCGTLTLSSTGVQTPTPATCW